MGLLIILFVSFMYIICSDAGLPFREELARSPQKILASAFAQFLPQAEGNTTHPSSSANSEGGVDGCPPAGVAATSDGYFHGLYLISTLVKLMPEWLLGNRIVFDTFLLVWKSPARISRLQNEQELSILQVSHQFIGYVFPICNHCKQANSF